MFRSYFALVRFKMHLLVSYVAVCLAAFLVRVARQMNPFLLGLFQNPAEAERFSLCVFDAPKGSVVNESIHGSLVPARLVCMSGALV